MKKILIWDINLLKNLHKIILIMLLILISNIAYSQSDGGVYYENDFTTFSLHSSAMGGLSITNIFNPLSFLSNPSILPFLETSGKLYIIGLNLQLPGSNMNMFYPFFDYDKLSEESSTNDEYLRTYQGLSSNYGYSGPVQFILLTKYFSVAVLNSSCYEMSYDSSGLPPGLTFRIDNDFMATFGMNLPVEFDLNDKKLQMSFGVRMKYIQRDTYYKKLSGDEFISLVDYQNSTVNSDTFKLIADGYSSGSAFGFDLGVTLKYDFFLTAFTYNNVSLIYGDLTGTKMTRKEYDEDGNEYTSSDITYIIPSTFNMSVALYFEKISFLSGINDFYIGIDIIDLFGDNFTYDNVNIGLHFVIFNIIEFMLGSDIKTFSSGLNIKLFFFDIGVSYTINLIELTETNDFNITLLFHL